MYSDFPLNDNQLCRIRAYFLTVIICSLFYSNALQSIYRLCRVVFYMRKRFQSFQVYIIGIVIQWIIYFLFILPALLFNHFEYLVADFHCQIPYRKFKNNFFLCNYYLCYSIDYSCWMLFFYIKKKSIKTNNDTNTETNCTKRCYCTL
jgi:hypothetical protein